MSFNTVESLRIALDNADRAVREAVANGNICEVMIEIDRDVVSLPLNYGNALAQNKTEENLWDPEKEDVHGRIRRPSVRVRLLQIVWSSTKGE
jgi:hypothetical protein